MTIHYETIKCPNCKTIQTAPVEHGVPFYSYVHRCNNETCMNWICESEWVRVGSMKRDYAVNALERLAVQLAKSKTLVANGINISDFEIGYSGIIEDSIGVILCNNDEAKHEDILADIAQWLYDGMTNIEEEDKTVIVETPAMLIDYILNYCE